MIKAAFLDTPGSGDTTKGHKQHYNKDLEGFSKYPFCLHSPGELQVSGFIPPAPVWDSRRGWAEMVCWSRRGHLAEDSSLSLEMQPWESLQKMGRVSCRPQHKGGQKSPVRS